MSSPGISNSQLSRDSFTRQRREVIDGLIPHDVDFFVASVDPSTLDVGHVLTLTSLAPAALRLKNPRNVSVTIDDTDSGGGLSVTVRVEGLRFGAVIHEDITVTAVDGSATTTNGSKVFDRVTRCSIVAVSNAGTGDTLTVGLAGSSAAGTLIGLWEPIDSLEDILSLCRRNSGVAVSPPITPSATTVDVEQSALICQAAAATTDVYEVVYRASRLRDAVSLNR